MDIFVRFWSQLCRIDWLGAMTSIHLKNINTLSGGWVSAEANAAVCLARPVIVFIINGQMAPRKLGVGDLMLSLFQNWTQLL